MAIITGPWLVVSLLALLPTTSANERATPDAHVAPPSAAAQPALPCPPRQR
jgi:hypothetical protein